MFREYGHINSYDPLKGFGFIRRGKGKDVFFHYTDLEFSEAVIGLGDTVSFSIDMTGKGPRAKSIKKESG